MYTASKKTPSEPEENEVVILEDPSLPKTMVSGSGPDGPANSDFQSWNCTCVHFWSIQLCQMIKCFLPFTCHASNSQAPSLAARQSHWASILETSKFNLWMKFPKSILIAVTLGDVGDSKLMTMREKHFIKLLDRAFTPVASFALQVPLGFQEHPASGSGETEVGAALGPLPWWHSQCLFPEQLVRQPCSSTADFKKAMCLRQSFVPAKAFLVGLSPTAQEAPRRKWLPVCARCFQPATISHQAARAFADLATEESLCDQVKERGNQTSSRGFFFSI